MDTAIQVPTVTLNNGVKMPVAGLGTFCSKNQEIMTELLRAAFEAGYTHIDTAWVYGNHEMIGQALKTIFAEGKFKREDIFITTKFFPKRELNAIEILRGSLKDLTGMGKFNNFSLQRYLIHWSGAPCGPDKVFINVKPQHLIWWEFEQCYKDGLTRSIGVSNYNVQSLVNLLSYCAIKPVVNQVEISPYIQQPGLLDFCRKFDIQVVGYSSLVRGGHDPTLKLGATGDIFTDPVLVEIAKAHNKSVAQVVLNYVQKTLGVIVLPKTEKKERLRENLDWQDFTLTQEENDQIKKLDRNLRTINPATLINWQYMDMFA